MKFQRTLNGAKNRIAEQKENCRMGRIIPAQRSDYIIIDSNSIGPLPLRVNPALSSKSGFEPCPHYTDR